MKLLNKENTLEEKDIKLMWKLYNTVKKHNKANGKYLTIGRLHTCFFMLELFIYCEEQKGHKKCQPTELAS